MRVFFVALTLAAAAESRGDYPLHGAQSVVDDARLLTPGDAATLRSEISSFKARTGVELVVFTLPSYLSRGTDDASFERFATNLFNRNGIGDASRNDGLMLLVAKAERKVRIETGRGYGRSLDASMKTVIDSVMTPRFKAGNFSAGIVEGARLIMQKAQSRTAAVQTAGQPSQSAPRGAPSSRSLVSAPSSSPQPSGETLIEAPPGYTPPAAPAMKPVSKQSSEPQRGGGPAAPGGFGWLAPLLALLGIGGSFLLGPVVLVFVVTGVLAVVLWLRARRSRCDECGVKMLRLSEAEDDQHLHPGQVREEQVGSANYDVLSCPSCRRQRIIKHSRWFSGFSACPRCSYKTVTTTSTVVVQPTYTNTGTRSVSARCHNCSYRSESTRVMPMLEDRSSGSVFSATSASSMSGGGFSSHGGGSTGGSSSGGGASGGW